MLKMAEVKMTTVSVLVVLPGRINRGAVDLAIITS
jgi:hypothetical protein